MSDDGWTYLIPLRKTLRSFEQQWGNRNRRDALHDWSSFLNEIFI